VKYQNAREATRSHSQSSTQPWKRGALLAAVATVAIFGLSVPQAFAYQLKPEVDNQFDQIVEYNYRGSAITNPPTCEAVCQELRSAETRPGIATSASELNTEARGLRVATKLLPELNFGRLALRAAGPVGIALLIGDITGINSKLLDLIFPGAGDAGNSYCLSCTQFVYYYRYPNPYPDWAGPSYPMQQGGVYAWGYSLGSGYLVRQVPDGSGPACDGDPVIPAEFHVLNGPSAGLRCSSTPVAAQAGYLLPSEVNSSSAILDYAGQHYDQRLNSPANPGLATTTTRTRSELESDRYPELNTKLEYELGVANVCDPADPNVCNPPNTDRARQRRCDLGSGGTGMDPMPGIGNALNDVRLYQVKTSFLRATTDGGETGTALKYGWTEPAPLPREWAGWGWRHVQAKHGWTGDDIDATQLALQSPPIPDGRSLIYLGPEYPQNGEVCQRRVVVAPAKVSDKEPEPKEIITSYGALATGG
jgi:hypothetical protein